LYTARFPLCSVVTSQHRTPPHNAPQFAKGHSSKNGRGPNTTAHARRSCPRVVRQLQCMRTASTSQALSAPARPAQTTPRSQRAKRPPPTGPHGGLEGGLHGAPGGGAPQAITGARAPRRLASTPAKATHPPTGPQEGGGAPQAITGARAPRRLASTPAPAIRRLPGSRPRGSPRFRPTARRAAASAPRAERSCSQSSSS
jgi:hypothetical protein